MTNLTPWCSRHRLWNMCLFFKTGLIQNGYIHSAKHPGGPHKDTSTNSSTPPGTGRCRRRGKDTGLNSQVTTEAKRSATSFTTPQHSHACSQQRVLAANGMVANSRRRRGDTIGSAHWRCRCGLGADTDHLRRHRVRRLHAGHNHCYGWCSPRVPDTLHDAQCQWPQHQRRRRAN
jgi:hypothetical protein